MPSNKVIGGLRWVMKTLRSSPRGLLMPFVFDLITLFALTLTTGLYARKVTEYMALISTGIASGGTMPTNLGQIAADSTLSSYINAIGILLIMMALSAYVIYTLLQGISWWYCGRYLAKGPSLLVYMKRFALLNLVWFIPFIILQMVQFINLLTSRLSSPSGTITFTVALVSFVGVYLVTLSYSFALYRPTLASFGFSFRHGLTSITLISGYVLMLVLFVLADLIVGVLGSTILQVVIGAILIIPLVSIMRIYLFWLVSARIAQGSTRRRGRAHPS